MILLGANDVMLSTVLHTNIICFGWIHFLTIHDFNDS